MFWFIKTMNDWFTNFFDEVTKNIDLTNITIFLVGILIGLLLAGCLYSLVLFISLKNNRKLNEVQTLSISEDKMVKMIEDIKKDFLRNTTGFSMTEKSKYLGHIIKDITNQIAAYYYPHSKYPIYELTISELLNLLTYINNRIDGILDKRIFKPFKDLSISQIVKIVETRKKASESKIAKVASKAHLKTISDYGFMLLNYANPYHWLKKIVFGGAATYTSNKISLIIIDIVADETNKVYSKRLFNTEEKIFNQQIEENLKDLAAELLKEEDHE